ncbi:hypothetical protein F0U44_12780 [Nocardioides humilatus]|uniref:Mce-associated membrane protein n=1 Tax=Nocardioides humilatus TaxID=2607660 RepID=A0A5B1LF85_9ACTN|nr:hypothetical protein [Nocardioides humilatus]KAA1419312.1 hypothetical protein F0U44_12780 [Nocardioides humilatus]
MSGRLRVAVGGLALLLIAAIAGCVLLWGDRSDLDELKDHQADEAAATKAAEEVVYSWLTYDYRTYAEDMAWVTEDGTASFEEEYAPETLVALRKKMVGPRQLISKGRVVESAATWEKDGKVKVLVFTDQTLTDKDIRQQRKPALHARSGVELTMVEQGGEWLVDELVQLQFE